MGGSESVPVFSETLRCFSVGRQKVSDCEVDGCEADGVVSEPVRPSPSVGPASVRPVRSLLTHTVTPALVCRDVAKQLPDAISFQSMNTAVCISTR